MHRVLASCLILASLTPARGQSYRSPYRVEFHYGVSELIGDLEKTERGDPRLESEIPFRGWYSRHTLERWKSWGPPVVDYPRPDGVDAWPIERKRERVVATALRYRGYSYQHHHIPDWHPPNDWPWQPTCAGSNGKGIDCSNLTGFVYNQGFGIRLNTDVGLQAEGRVARGERLARLHQIDLPANYAERLKSLCTGDLVFIRAHRGKVSHVVIWVGPIGKSPDGVPLVIDSHGEDVKDSDGTPIPCGVQLRPFRESSWYNRSASHALRVIRE